MAAAGRDLLPGQVSDGYGKLDWDGAEADADGSVRLLDVVDGEPGDRRGPLGIEEQQQPDGENQLDDLIGMIGSNDVKSAVLMARDTYMSAVQAVLAHRGDISPSTKWIAHRLARADVDDLPMDDAWNILTMRDCADADWPLTVARKAHRLFLAVEQSIAGHTRCGAASPRGVERRLGVRTFRNGGATVVADVARHRTGDVGGYIWSMCDGAHAEDDMARCLARDLGLSPADAAAHVAAAVGELRVHGLLT